MREIFIVSLLMLAAPSLARGDARVVSLLGVIGPGGDRFADQLIDDLSELYDVVGGSRYRAVAARLRASGASPEEVQVVAAELHLDAVIGGAIVGEGQNRRLAIAVRDGATGRVIARRSYDLGAETLPLIRERVMRDLVRALERAGTGTVEESPRTVEEETHAPELSVSAPTPRVEATSQGVFAGVGYSVMSRTLSFDARSAPAFDGGTLSGVRADAAVFPLALSAELAQAHPVLASFGLVASYEYFPSFTESNPFGSTRGKSSHWSVLVVGRIPLGHGARGGTLQVETGAQGLDWSSESTLDARIPDVGYRLVDLGLGWDRPLGTKKLSAALRLAYLALVEGGGITSAEQYGGASGGGVEFEAGLTARPLGWLWLRLGARLDAIALSFAKNGTRFASSSRDVWMAGTLEVGFAL